MAKSEGSGGGAFRSGRTLLVPQGGGSAPVRMRFNRKLNRYEYFQTYSSSSSLNGWKPLTNRSLAFQDLDYVEALLRSRGVS